MKIPKIKKDESLAGICHLPAFLSGRIRPLFHMRQAHYWRGIIYRSASPLFINKLNKRTMEEKQKYQSGIYGRAEARFGGKIAIEPVSFTNGDGIERHGLTLSEFYSGSEVGTAPTDQRTHEPQIQLVFDNIKSVDIMERALATVREMMKRDAEKADPSEQLSPEMKVLLSQKVEELDLSVRTRNILKANGIDTILDICRMKKTDWLKFRNGGKKSLTELDDFLTSHNLAWGMDA